MTTIREIEEAIEQFEREEFGRRGGFWDEFRYMGVVDIGIGRINVVDIDDVGSDESSFIWTIFHFDSPNESPRYFRKCGYHSSWDGNEWDGKIVEVEKKEVIKYEWRVK